MPQPAGDYAMIANYPLPCSCDIAIPMIDFDDTYSQNDYDERPTKGQLKRENERLKKIGEKLLELSDAQLAKLPLTEKLQAAIAEGRRLKPNTEAVRRHKQYMGKIIKEADTATIEERIQEFENAHQLNTRQFHELEILRDQLVNGDNNTIGEVIARYPQVDTQKLRQMVRNAKKELDHNEAHPDKADKTHSRKLFRYLRELSEL